MYIALDQKYVNEGEFQDTYKHCEKVRKIVDGLNTIFEGALTGSTGQPAQQANP